MLDGEIHQAIQYQELLFSSEASRDLVNANKNTVGSNESAATKPSTKDEPVKEERDIQSSKSQTEKLISNIASNGDQLVKREEKEVGDTGLKPYIDYLKQNKGFLYCVCAGLGHLIFLIGQILGNTWMAAKLQSPQIGVLRLIIVYSAIRFTSIFFLFLRSLFTVLLGLKASNSFFSELLTSLFRAPIAFFDATPLGRVLNRVSSDFSVLDVDIPFSFVMCMSSTMIAYRSLGVVAVVTWQVLFATIPLIYLAFRLQKYYFSSAKELMRLNGTTKSPIANHFGESIARTMTIRAFRVEDQFFKKNLYVIDKNSSPFFYGFSANEWLIQRLEMSNATVICSSALAMVLLPKGSFNPGFVGMALSYGLDSIIEHIVG